MTAQKTLTQSGYISIDEVATNLGVGRTNVYYYVNQLKIQTKKFSLDRKTYVSKTDFERIKVVKAVATVGSARVESEDVLVFLAGLGLAVTPHADPTHGWGYAWFGGEWNGPYPAPTDAIKAAFELADTKAQQLRDMPFPTEPGQLFWWDGEEWYSARHKEGELQIRTFNLTEDEGYEP